MPVFNKKMYWFVLRETRRLKKRTENYVIRFVMSCCFAWRLIKMINLSFLEVEDIRLHHLENRNSAFCRAERPSLK